jgi:hypothetical protein
LVNSIPEKEQKMRLFVAEGHPVLGADVKKGLEQCHYVVDLTTDVRGSFPLQKHSNVRLKPLNTALERSGTHFALFSLYS